MHRLPDIMDTERLRLRRAKPSDAEALFSLFNNWVVVKWLARPSWPNEIARTHAYLEQVNQSPLGEHYWAIERAGGLVGGISAGIQPASAHQSAEGPHIGYWLGERFWGQGVMTCAASLLCEAIFACTEEPAIYSGVFLGNEGSLRIQHKLGFRVEGRDELFSTPLGRPMPHVSTRLLRNDFRPVA
ncbi:GNAT family N-acetyltransferase [Rhabdaerophilum sp.]|uniref:GNAT family N-acetyltransferase n=1 Tax=Rhabdaerophilum sp. TaxID=2717341 RepID=UPI0038D376B2